MVAVVAQVRSVYYRALMVLLFPFVFLITLAEEIPAQWYADFKKGFLCSFAMGSVMALGLLAVYVIKNNF